MLNWDHIYYTNVSTSMSQLENNIAVVTGPLLHLAEVAACAENLFGAAGVATSDHSAGSSEGSSLSVARLGGQETGETSAVAGCSSVRSSEQPR